MLIYIKSKSLDDKDCVTPTNTLLDKQLLKQMELT